MQAFHKLREIARDRRERAIVKAREEYEAILVRIAALEQDLLGRDRSTIKSIYSCVESVIPTDGPFTSGDLLLRLEALDQRRAWHKRSVDHCISTLRARGVVRRLSKSRAGAAHVVAPAVYVKAGVKVDSQPFGDASLVDVLYEVLRGKSLTLTELTVAVMEAGYVTAMKPKALRDHSGRAMRKDSRFHASGERWTCR
ncbi:MAG TPA: hypothetical protein VGY55_01690 [Pirellulales bacterium]|jgi:hypothetical protein|nr:hypothetical protein [Pirellulales bacterium]